MDYKIEINQTVVNDTTHVSYEAKRPPNSFQYYMRRGNRLYFRNSFQKLVLVLSNYTELKGLVKYGDWWIINYK